MDKARARRPELRAERYVAAPAQRPKGPARRPPPKKPGLLLKLFRLGLILAVWGLVILGGAVAYFAFDLPDVSRIGEVQRNPSVQLVSADGQTLATFGDLYGEFIPVGQLPPSVAQALIATEDRRFYSHFGIDPIGLARASFVNFRAGRVVQGGSGVTQQLAKNVFLTPERTPKRKVQEVLLSLWLERHYTKDQILTIYLNRVYFGSGAYGIDAAANRYFDKSARRLTLQESAMLIGLLKAPSRYAPTRDLDAARRRAGDVIDNMADVGFITPQAAEAAKAAPAGLALTRQASRNARYFAEWVFDDIDDYVGRGWSDIVVTSTLDTRLQAFAEKALDQVLSQYGDKRHIKQGAIVALSPDGAVRAMVGGRDWRESSFNRATQARRQPGSAFKYFVYLAGLEAGYLPEQEFMDGPISIGNWQPKNFDQRYIGSVSLQEAFARSINTVAVELSEAVGRERVVEMAHRLGITSDLPVLPSIALGSAGVNLLELTAAFGTVGNGGYGVLAHGITEIKTRDGKVLFRRSGGGVGRVLDSRVASAMADLMVGVIEGGTGKAAKLDRPAGGKSGTSQDFRDAWFVGFSGDLTTGVWLGNDDNAPTDRVTGGTLPATVWKGFMSAALAGAPVRGGPVQPSVATKPSLWQKILAEFGQAAPPAPEQRRRYPIYEDGPDPTVQP